MEATSNSSHNPPSPSISSGSGSPTIEQINEVRQTIWQTRPDLREACQWSQSRFEWWLALIGRREFRMLAEINLAIPEELVVETSEKALADVKPAMTRLMELVWSLRTDLQRAFDHACWYPLQQPGRSGNWRL